MNLEEFKEIPNYSRYMISPNGEVWDKKREKLRSWTNNEGVIMVSSAFADNGKNQCINVRRMVYKCFVDDSLKPTTQVESIDGDIWNNHYSNIRPAVRSTGKRRDGFMELSVNESSDRRGIDRTARSVWKSMMDRCYNETTSNYIRYGAIGVTVCKEWHVYENFYDWFKDNYIEGFSLDKDIAVEGNKEYSPIGCSFVPLSINSLFAHPETPIVEKYKRGSYTLRCYIACKYVVFKGWSEEECLEQYNLVRQLQLEKLTYLMLEYHKSLKEKYPTTPEIDSRVLKRLCDAVT